MNANAQAFPKRHKITVQEYERMGEAGIFSEDERVELIEGEIIDMAPIGTKHADTVRKLIQALAGKLPATAILDVQNPIRLDNNTEPQPDIAILKHRSYAHCHPAPSDILLLIEVSDASANYDRSVKVPLYAHAGIPEVWLIDLTGGFVEVFRKPSPSGYQEISRHSQSERLRPLLVPEVEVALQELFH